MESILRTTKGKCYLCGRVCATHRHHIYDGSHRKASEEHGFVVYLCPEHHNMSDNGVHFNRALDLRLKAHCQLIYEKTHTREDFLNVIHRNYIT